MNPLFDRALLRARRARAAAGPARADYLLARMAGDVAERLTLVSRKFPLALAIGGGALLGRALERSGAATKIGTLISADLDFAAAMSHRGPTAPYGETNPPSPHPNPPPEGEGIRDRDLGLAIVCDDERLPAAPGALDLIVSLGVLQWANDPLGVLIQARRALKPDGLFLGALIGGVSLMELREAFLEAEAELESCASPRVAPMIDVRDLGHLLQRSGLALPVTDIDRIEVTFKTPSDLLRDLRAMGATNNLRERRRAPLRRATFLRAMEIYARRFHDREGRVVATFEILHGSGWAPHPSQQQPLRPGSATMRLGDALDANTRKDGKRPT